MKYTEVQSQQKAFTQNPSLSNNPKILAHYLVCLATTECIQCCQYSTFIHRLVTNIVIWWPTLWMHNVVNISAHPGCHPQRLTFEIDKSNIYHWKSMYFIYITHYIIYSAWYIYIYSIYWSQYICLPCLSSPEINIWGLCIFQPERRQPCPFKPISGHYVYLWWVPTKSNCQNWLKRVLCFQCESEYS